MEPIRNIKQKGGILLMTETMVTMMTGMKMTTESRLIQNL